MTTVVHNIETGRRKRNAEFPAGPDVAPRLPSPFAPTRKPTGDVVTELLHNRDAYTCTKDDVWITIRDIPCLVDTTIKRAINLPVWAANNERKPGYATVCVCALSIGLHQLATHDAMAAIRDVNTEIYSIPDVDSDKLDEAANFASDFVLGSMDSLTGGRREPKNMQVPLGLRIELAEFAKDLGLSATKLDVVCLVYALRYQPFTATGHSTHMEASIDRFIRRAGVRAELARVLIDKWLRVESEMQS